MLPEKKMMGSHRGIRRITTRDWRDGRDEVGQICPRRAFLAYLALHTPRSVALADFFSILLGGGRRRCPEERVHESVALKILQILNRLPDSDQSHGQLEFLGNRNDDPSASGAVELRQDQAGDADRLMELTGLGQRVLPNRGV